MSGLGGGSVLGGLRGLRSAAPRAPKGKAFTPYRIATNPPAGTYDPALGAQVRQSNRGLSDLLSDTGLQNAQSLSDYNIATQRIGAQQQQGLADLATALQRENGAYGTATQNLGTQYKNLAANQTDAARAAGVAEGGALTQALAKRTANQGVAQSALDTTHNQAVADNATQVGRLNDSTQNSLADQLLGYQRGVTGRDTTLQRAQRENTFFGQDVGAEEFAQAKAGGYVAPGRPANEHGTGNGVYQVQTIGGHKYSVGPNGKILGRLPSKGRVALGLSGHLSGLSGGLAGL